MKITAIKAQKNNDARVNVFIDGGYSFSLDISQLVEMGLKVGRDVSKSDMTKFANESEFGKLYSRSLKYCLDRPRSMLEIKKYLLRRTFTDKKNGVSFSDEIVSRVIDRLIEKRYIDDFKFASFWVENRMVRRGISRLKLTAELRGKGVRNEIIEQVLRESDRDEIIELKKVIEKKRSKYGDEKKLIQYLVRLGFNYDDVKNSLKID